jgi:hypothetical protein
MTDTTLKVTPLFPSQTTAGAGLRLDTTNGRYTFSLDHGNLGVQGSYTPQPGDTVLLFDGINFFRVPITSIMM